MALNIRDESARNILEALGDEKIIATLGDERVVSALGEDGVLKILLEKFKAKKLHEMIDKFSDS